MHYKEVTVRFNLDKMSLHRTTLTSEWHENALCLNTCTLKVLCTHTSRTECMRSSSPREGSKLLTISEGQSGMAIMKKLTFNQTKIHSPSALSQIDPMQSLTWSTMRSKDQRIIVRWGAVSGWHLHYASGGPSWFTNDSKIIVNA